MALASQNKIKKVAHLGVVLDDKDIPGAGLPLRRNGGAFAVALGATRNFGSAGVLRQLYLDRKHRTAIRTRTDLDPVIEQMHETPHDRKAEA